MLPLGERSSPVLFRAKLELMLFDEEAKRQVFHTRGVNAMFFCTDCKNCVKKNAELARHSDWLRDSTCIELREFKQHDDASIRLAVDEVARADADYKAGRIPKVELERALQDFGFNHDAYNVLSDDRFRVGAVSQSMHDWFHIYLVTGIFQYEVAILFTFLSKTTVFGDAIWEQARHFVQKFTWPKLYTSPADLLDSRSISDEGTHFRCSASEGLCLYAVLAMFLITIVCPENVCMAGAASFLALSDVLDLLVASATGHVSPDVLHAAITLHLQRHLTAYADIAWVPKHHYSLHLAQALRRFGFLISLFTLERKHKEIKRWVKDRRKKSSFELGLLEELLCDHMQKLVHYSFEHCGLNDPTAPNSKMRALLANVLGLPTFEGNVSRSLRTSTGATIFAGDVALAAQSDGRRLVGEVWFHMEVNGSCFTGISFWERVTMSSDTKYAKTYRKKEEPEVIKSAALETSLIYLLDGDMASVLVPVLYRD